MFIIDGYNVIYKWKSLSGLKDNMELARSRLIDALVNYQGYTGEDIMVVFDSSVNDNSTSETILPGINVVFTQKGQTADTFIERFVYAHPDPSKITVVTADRLFCMTVLQKNSSIIAPDRFEEEVNRVCMKKRG